MGVEAARTTMSHPLRARDGDLTSLHDLLARLRSGDQLGLAKDIGEAAPRRAAPRRTLRAAPRRAATASG